MTSEKAPFPLAKELLLEFTEAPPKWDEIQTGEDFLSYFERLNDHRHGFDNNQAIGEQALLQARTANSATLTSSGENLSEAKEQKLPLMKAFRLPRTPIRVGVKEKFIATASSPKRTSMQLSTPALTPVHNNMAQFYNLKLEMSPDSTSKTPSRHLLSEPPIREKTLPPSSPTGSSIEQKRVSQQVTSPLSAPASSRVRNKQRQSDQLRVRKEVS